MKRSLFLASLSVAALITLSACGSSSGDDMEGMGTESSAAAAPSATAETTTEEASADAMAEHNQADVMFARMMIPHHEQAVEMSDMMLTKDGISPEITDLATQIREAQGPEIETMQGWLETWDDAMGPESMESQDMGDMGGADGDGMGSGSGQMGGMEGMMSEDEMSELASAEGTDASRLFLESMTVHHEGAIDMAQNEIKNGENPEAIALAENIVTTQQAEITEMKELLADL